MFLSPVRNHRYQAFSQENIHAAWDAWVNHVEQYRDKTTVPRYPGSRWLQRGVSHTSAAAPFLTNLPAAKREIANLWQNAAAGNKLETFEALQRLSKAGSSSIKTSQTIGDALRELFMAHDRYHQARIEAAYKEAEAAREQSKFNWHNTIDDLLRDQEHDNLMLQCISNMIARYNETCSRVIANF
ncbi:hypothetical protein M3P05_10830 [Sansalvadorimonas sp. 2012CJ34-2]|uniref:Uncharacterized protein n=1 Tax=Parendozoicomonas callyspongiae TaxID=2942213 RepID=A0ABT0PGC6_9GAMM|nr:hypothetical protein [Sansalvadorimonas sp. 2012CJ34-2]MCL6270414.1 hypothetical protein [Sansalvadorimonas sp. 2012CJ34-2]